MKQRGQPNGWDNRDYLLWSEISQLPSYQLIEGGRDQLVSRNSVIRLLEQAAEKRYKNERAAGQKPGACPWCADGNPRVRSSVSEAFVHTDTPVGRVVCRRP
jgi:hypothetical protein